MIGIIPAGGEGSRWNGIPKMLLPYHAGGKKWSFIDYTIDSMARAGADKFVIIASRDTIGPLTRHLHNVPNVFYGINEFGMWEAMQVALSLVRDEVCLFGMPDTFHNRDLFERMVAGYKKDSADFVVGFFHTYTPERFGILVPGGRVVNKPTYPLTIPQVAWGALLWGAKVSHLWRVRAPSTYTDAVNLALQKTCSSLVQMDYYYDMASFKDYERLLYER